MPNCLPNHLSLPLSAHAQYVASQSVAAQAAEQAAAQEQLAEKAQGNKITVVGEDQQRLIQHVLQQNLLAMATQLPLKIKLNNRGELFYFLQTFYCFVICNYLYSYTLYANANQPVQRCLVEKQEFSFVFVDDI